VLNFIDKKEALSGARTFEVAGVSALHISIGPVPSGSAIPDTVEDTVTKHSSCSMFTGSKHS
jgi:hypothetical protein